MLHNLLTYCRKINRNESSQFKINKLISQLGIFLIEVSAFNLIILYISCLSFFMIILIKIYYCKVLILLLYH